MPNDHETAPAGRKTANPETRVCPGCGGTFPQIEKLTPKQEAELPAFWQRYLDMATNGTRINRDDLERALNDAYHEIGKPMPQLLIFDSPAMCMMELKILDLPKQGKLSDQFTDRLSGQLWRQLLDQIRGQLEGQLDGQLRKQISGQLSNQIQKQLSNQLFDQLFDQFWVQLSDRPSDQRLWNSQFMRGSHDLYWIAWAKFAEKIGVSLTSESSRRLDIMARISEQCEWWWPHENAVVVSQKPTTVHWDDNRRLHCENGPAVEYADGYTLFMWHGHRIPADWVLKRDTIDPAEILKCQYVEQRAAGAACIGWPRMLSVLNYQLIDSDPDPAHGELIEISGDKLGLPESGRFLKAECPRNGTICEGVPGHINSVLEAQAWRIGLTPAEFSYPKIRT